MSMVCVHEIEHIVEFINRAMVSNSVGQMMIWEALSLRGGHGKEELGDGNKCAQEEESAAQTDRCRAAR